MREFLQIRVINLIVCHWGILTDMNLTETDETRLQLDFQNTKP